MSVLLYDPDCGFCTACARTAARLTPGTAILPGTPGVLKKYAVPTDRFAQAIPFVNERGHAIYGADAIALTLRTCPSGLMRCTGWVLLRAPVRPLVARAYTLVAQNRQLISRPLRPLGIQWGESCSIRQYGDPPR